MFNGSIKRLQLRQKSAFILTEDMGTLYVLRLNIEIIFSVNTVTVPEQSLPEERFEGFYSFPSCTLMLAFLEVRKIPRLQYLTL